MPRRRDLIRNWINFFIPHDNWGSETLNWLAPWTLVNFFVNTISQDIQKRHKFLTLHVYSIWWEVDAHLIFLINSSIFPKNSIFFINAFYFSGSTKGPILLSQLCLQKAFVDFIHYTCIFNFFWYFQKYAKSIFLHWLKIFMQWVVTCLIKFYCFTLCADYIDMVSAW